MPMQLPNWKKSTDSAQEITTHVVVTRSIVDEAPQMGGPPIAMFTASWYENAEAAGRKDKPIQQTAHPVPAAQVAAVIAAAKERPVHLVGEAHLLTLPAFKEAKQVA